MNTRRRIAGLLALAATLALAVVSLAPADNLNNDVAAVSGSDTITAGGQTTITYQLVANNASGSPAGCDATATNAATMQVNAPSGVTATPSSVSFTECGQSGKKTVAFSSSTPGDSPITHTITGGVTGAQIKNNSDFTLHVVAATPTNEAPELTVPSGLEVEGNTAGGANVTYTGISASDAEDGDISGDVQCDPADGSFFALGGPHQVACDVTDGDGATDTGTFPVTVVDTTNPSLSGVPSDMTAEATGPGGAAVTYTAPTAFDIVDSDVGATCSPASGSTFALGTTTVTCAATDDSGNTASDSFDVTVRDTTAPVISGTPSDITAEATGPNGATVSYTAPTASDLVDGTVSVACLPASGSTFALGATTVTCTASDNAGNEATDEFDVIVRDTMAPALVLPGTITKTATGSAQATATWTATATDLVDGTVPVSCTPPSGSSFSIGSTTVNCSATDNAGNTANGSFTVKVEYPWSGFLAPIDNPETGKLNGVKAGSSVPVKFKLGGDQGLSIFMLGKPSSAEYNCGTTALIDSDIATMTAGSSSLSYDPVSQTYSYVWKTDKAWAGQCRRFSLGLNDGSTHDVYFKMMK